jgi:ATP-dependent RNA helicase CshB
MEDSKFKRFELQPFLIEALTDQGFKRPTEIQERLILAIRNGKDVIGQSQTGSGKTLAFLLPIVDQININKQEVQAVITAPTRELANQIYQELNKLLAFQKVEGEISSKLLVGGTDRAKTISKLKVQPHIVIGTPGRINDMVKEQALLVHTTNCFVVDEADQMLDMGFLPEVDTLASCLGEKIQMLVFSATIPESLQPFLKKYMNSPRHVHVTNEDVTAPKIEHRLIPLRHRNKIQFALDVAKKLNPYLAIIFTNTKEHADLLANAMVTEGLNVERLHGGLTPRHRKQVMKQLNEAKIQYLVATDLAARGIDIKGISHIINYELPKDLDFYTHRVGRTARAGEEGIAVTIFEQEKDHQAIEKLLKQGTVFSFVDLKKGEWEKIERPSITSASEKSNRRKGTKTKGVYVPLGKKVKPGYKRKVRWAKEKIAKKNQRTNKK